MEKRSYPSIDWHDENDEAINYRPVKKIRAGEKDRIEKAIAHIRDEADRAREWFRLLYADVIMGGD